MNFLQISVLKLLLLLISSIRAQTNSSKECKKKAGDLIIKTNPVIVEERREGSKITTIQIREDRYLGSLTCHILQDSGQSFQTHFSAESVTEFPGSSYDIFRFGKPLPKKRYFDCDIFLSNIEGLSKEEISIDLDVVLLLQPLNLANAASSNPCTNPIVSRKKLTIILPGINEKDTSLQTTVEPEDITLTESILNPSNLGPTLISLTSNPTRATTWSSTFSPIKPIATLSDNEITTLLFEESSTDLPTTSVYTSSLPKDETNSFEGNNGIELTTLSTKAETPSPIIPSFIYQSTQTPDSDNNIDIWEESSDFPSSFTIPSTTTNIDYNDNAYIGPPNSEESINSSPNIPENESSSIIGLNSVDDNSVNENNLYTSLPSSASSDPEKTAYQEDESLNNEDDNFIPQPENNGSLSPIGINQGDYNIPLPEEESQPEEDPTSSRGPSNENATLIAGPPIPINNLNQESTSSTSNLEKKDHAANEEGELSVLFGSFLLWGFLFCCSLFGSVVASVVLSYAAVCGENVAKIVSKVKTQVKRT
ncbi:uncharacterized protein [Lepeophtheirus salmonis]|uniref:uncharacterized protein n=1 Tax=Lepeophtheirus salmonis TaxID=72036 RepID=UPI003AF3CCDA